MIPKLTKIIFVVASIALLIPSHAADRNEITVFTGSQTADGMTQDDLNMEMLAEIELTTKNKLKEKFGIEIPYWRDSLKICLSRILT